MAKYIVQLRRGTKEQWTAYEDNEKTREESKPLEGELVVEYDNGIPRLKIGDGETPYSQLPYISVDSFILPKQAYIELGTQWYQDADNRWFQEVKVQNADITSNSKVDLLPDAKQLSIFHTKDLAFVAENEDGTVRVYCVGQVPKNPYTIKVSVTEVVANG